MTWNAALPAGTNRLRDSDDFIRENQDCLEDAFDREHTFPGTKCSTAGQHMPGACKVLKVDTTANLGSGTGVAGAISYDTTTGSIMRDTGSALSAISAVFASGTKMFFYQATAPTGWTIDASVTDKLLAVKGGSAAYNVDGGNTAGTWTQPNHTHTGGSHTHTGPSHTHSTGSYSLTIAQMPAHSHVQTTYSSGAPGNSKILGGGISSCGSSTSSSKGSGSSHSHGNTGAGGTGTTSAGGTGATGGGATAASYRPAATIGIICEKD